MVVAFTVAFLFTSFLIHIALVVLYWATKHEKLPLVDYVALTVLLVIFSGIEVYYVRYSRYPHVGYFFDYMWEVKAICDFMMLSFLIVTLIRSKTKKQRENALFITLLYNSLCVLFGIMGVLVAIHTVEEEKIDRARAEEEARLQQRERQQQEEEQAQQAANLEQLQALLQNPDVNPNLLLHNQ